MRVTSVCASVHVCVLAPESGHLGVWAPGRLSVSASLHLYVPTSLRLCVSVSVFASVSVSVSMNMCVCAIVYVFKCVCVCVCVCVKMPVTPTNCLNTNCARMTDTSICAHTTDTACT